MVILAAWMGLSVGFVLGALWCWAVRDAQAQAQAPDL
jgi:hypothetical protein